MMLTITPHFSVPLREIDFSFARSSGPGGQNVNKVNSKAILKWNFLKSPSVPLAVRARFLGQYSSRLTEAGELTITSDRTRDQGKNKADCLEKLRDLLLTVAHPPKLRRDTKPTRSSKEKRLRSKQSQSEKKKNRKAYD